MKIIRQIILITLGVFLNVTFSLEGNAQSKAPIYDAPKDSRPRSKSKLPGNRKPISMSRRAISMHRFGWNIGGNIGSAYSLTDASGSSLNQRPGFLNTQWNTMSLNLGGFATYRFHENFAINTSLNYARLHGADSIAGRNRGFYFNNTILEMAVTTKVYAPISSPGFPFDFYGFIGIAGFYHNPQLTVPNPAPADFTWDQYSSLQPAIPIGFGFNYIYNRNLILGYEVGWRKTFFDYLDGFTRPWSKASDSYYFASLKVSYYIPQQRRRW
jgi:hypothetical protein